jgi:chemotaxis protein histidine kinase CheA/ActR/RegA family two-component response regulator
MPSTEILAVLADEVAEAGDTISASLARLVNATDESAFEEARAEYGEQVQRIALASEALNLDGLKSVCDFIERNLAAVKPGEFKKARARLFDHWTQLVLGYLKAPLDGVYSRELVETFRRSAWPQPLDTAAGQALERVLLAINDDTCDIERAPARETVARAEDVVLEIPDDVNRNLVDAFLTEGPLQAAEYSTLIQGIVRGEGWSEELNECRRLIHALKGSANTVSVRGVAALCHHVEDVLEHLARNSLLPKGQLGVLLVKVADTLETMFEALLGTGEMPTDAQAVLQDVLNVINRIDQGEYDPGAMVASGANPETGTNAGDGREPPTPDTQPQPAPRSVAKSSEHIEPKVRVDVRAIDDMLRTSAELTISCGHVMERVQQAIKAIGELRERQSALWDRSNDMESFVATQGIAAGRRQALAAANDATSSGFDPLEMDQYNELHTHVHGFTETVADLQLLGTHLVDTLTAVETATRQHASLNSELYDLLMTSRMVPARQLESRLQRIVRQVAAQCGKQVALRVEGTDVMLDDQMVNTLIDPLQHLLRNAVDHGIEMPATRAEVGKPETGEIVLTFARDGKYLVVNCRDDGAGLDLARVYDRALKRGLIDENRDLEENEIARLILQHGFSTTEAVTEVSGRGVGMDIVNTQVAKLKGSIDIQTETGNGATFALRLPIALGVVHCLLVVAQGETYALSSTNLEQIVYEGGRDVRRDDNGWHYGAGDLSCPAYFLAHVVGVAEGAASAEERERHVVIMNDISGRVGIVVDTVIGGQELVVKKPGRFLTRVKGIVGASILGNGSVVPILELTELLRIERGEIVTEHQAAPTDNAVADVLVVDDSLSVRTALSTMLMEEGFHVRTAKDGVEAIEAIAERRPAVIVADLEMPRMNGLELTAHVRAGAATRDLPVIMVTSRTAEKHRKQAAAAGVDDYITKPYREHDLVMRLRTILRKAA